MMRRRDLLTLTAAVTGGAALAATGCTPHPVGPAPEGAPVDFATTPAWSGMRSNTTIIAARNRHLVAMTEVAEARRIFAHGQVPVVVNVTGPTAWALLLDDDGTWITRPVTVRDDAPRPSDPGTALTELHRGPAVIDDTHAWIVVGVLPFKVPGVPGTRRSEKPRGPVVLLKIRLADGAVVASTTISDDLQTDSLQNATLSFTEDGASLLLAGSSLGTGDGWIGLRLATADLSVEFDARSLYDDRRLRDVSPAGQGLLVAFSHPYSAELLRLADGHRHSVLDHSAVILDGWVLRRDLGFGQQSVLIATQPSSGRQVRLTDRADLPTWPNIFSENRTFIDFEPRARLRVWHPEAPELGGGLEKGPFPDGAAVFKDVLYTWRDDEEGTALTLHRLGTGEVLAERRLPQGLLGHGVGAVTPWGIISPRFPLGPDLFLRATTWLS